MIKNVVICLFLTFILSSCTTYSSSYRDADRCTYAMVNPDRGSIKEAIAANSDNWYVNAPDCERIQDDLGIKKGK